MLEQLGKQLEKIKNCQLTWEEVPVATIEDIDNMIKVEGETIYINSNSK